jgi:hypothetical protein
MGSQLTFQSNLLPPFSTLEREKAHYDSALIILTDESKVLGYVVHVTRTSYCVWIPYPTKYSSENLKGTDFVHHLGVKRIQWSNVSKRNGELSYLLHYFGSRQEPARRLDPAGFSRNGRRINTDGGIVNTVINSELHKMLRIS